MKYYDYIMGLGSNCHTASLLKRLRLQGPTNVFDWSAGEVGVGGFKGKVDLICNKFADAFNREDLEYYPYPDTSIPTIPMRNKRTTLHYIHDFPKEKSIDAEFEHYKQKYLNRVDRLYSALEKSKRVLFLFIIKDEILPQQDIEDAEKQINKMFDNKVDFFIIQNITEGEQQEIQVNEHITILLFPDVFLDNRGKFNPKVDEYLSQAFMTEYKTQYKTNYLQTEIDNLTVYVKKLSNVMSDEQIIKASGLFDAKWYAKTYSVSADNLIEHYLTVGYKENMNPSLNFDGNKYLLINSDVQKSGKNPLLHYLRYGKFEGRKKHEVKK